MVSGCKSCCNVPMPPCTRKSVPITASPAKRSSKGSSLRHFINTLGQRRASLAGLLGVLGGVVGFHRRKAIDGRLRFLVAEVPLAVEIGRGGKTLARHDLELVDFHAIDVADICGPACNVGACAYAFGRETLR